MECDVIRDLNYGVEEPGLTFPNCNEARRKGEHERGGTSFTSRGKNFRTRPPTQLLRQTGKIFLLDWLDPFIFFILMCIIWVLGTQQNGFHFEKDETTQARLGHINQRRNSLFFCSADCFVCWS